MLVLRSLLFSFAFHLTTAAFTILGSPLLLGPRRYAMLGLKIHARFCLWLLRAITGTTLEVRGREFIPTGAAIVASKHQSTWETFALVPLLSDPAIVMKAELGWIPFYGWFAHKFGHILVARERGPAALRRMIADAKRCTSTDRQIVIFPEGTRQAVGAPPNYKSGVVALYEGLGLPCVPVALNSGAFWPRRSMMRYPGTIVVEFLEPLPAGLDRATFRRTLEDRIETASARLLSNTHGASIAAIHIETLKERQANK
ncbi:MAG: lysophospholipid acyltransferase family protein [Hyphomicrobiaceae bacterium]